MFNFLPSLEVKLTSGSILSVYCKPSHTMEQYFFPYSQVNKVLKIMVTKFLSEKHSLMTN